MAADHLLSELCSICHTNLPKYRCPRCQTQTCSLPCVQRHKARAQCNGQRDPTAYIKKQNLATPSAIDHDFNFIRSVERGVDKGEEILNSHGYGDRERWQKNYPALQRRFQEVGVRVQKAPTGLSRNRENTTHWAAKSKSLFWTVEWIFEDQSRHLDNFNEHTVLEQAHTWLLRRITNDKRKDGPEGTGSDKRSKRRKAKAEKVNSNVKATEVSTVDSIAIPAQPMSDGKEPSLDQIDAEEPTAGDHENASIEKMDPTLNDLTGTDERNVHSNIEVGEGPRSKDVADPPATQLYTDPVESITTEISDIPKADLLQERDQNKSVEEPIRYHFYLVKPRTTASNNAKVLIPLPSSSTLATALKGQLVLEFPTLQVFTQGADHLPEGHMLDKEYVREEQKIAEKLEKEVAAGADEEIKLAIPGDDDYEIEGGTEGSDSNARMPNQSDLMTILQRDIMG